MSSHTCPSKERFEGDIAGCGSTFEAEPDEEGLVDCPECGIWFNPEIEKKTS